LRVAEAGDDEAVAALAFDYLSWAAGRLRDEYGVEWPAIVYDEVLTGVRAYRHEGVVLLAEQDGDAIGMAAVRTLADGAAEIKRMYVAEAARGKHVGSLLLDGLLADPIATAAPVVRLDTVRFMADAQRLYRSRGFTERGPYEGTEIPPALQQHWLFFERATPPR